MKAKFDRFKNPHDGSRKRSAPQPHKLAKHKDKYKFNKQRIIVFDDDVYIKRKLPIIKFEEE